MARTDSTPFIVPVVSNLKFYKDPRDYPFSKEPLIV